MSRPMKKTASLISISLLAVGLAVAQKVRTDYDRSLDFQQFKTYAWMEDIKLPMPALLDARELDGWVRSAVEEQLESRGLQIVDAGQADLLATYFTYVRSNLENQEADVQSRARLPYGHWRPFAETAPDSRLHTEGVLIVDLVNAQNKTLVWRGEISDALKDPGNAEKIRKKIEKAAPKLFKKFPRRPAKM